MKNVDPIIEAYKTASIARAKAALVKLNEMVVPTDSRTMFKNGKFYTKT
tara:strand:+ start:2098 stop:2244 length:147 start_codon:yes stop_codon:yes gene_type:complete